MEPEDAARALERQQKKREEQRRTIEKRQKAEATKAILIAEAEAELHRAQEKHREIAASIDKRRAQLENQQAAEEERWQKELERLKDELQRRRNR